MACYVLSNDNRFFVATEANYGVVPAVTAPDRFPAVKLEVRQRREKHVRRDKTGGRTFVGYPNELRKETQFGLQSYLTAWTERSREPGYGPLFRAAMGGTPKHFTGGTVASVSGVSVAFSGAHGLTVGQAVVVNGEMRFVIALVDTSTVVINAPFSVPVPAGTVVTETMSYGLDTYLGSVSIFDFWSPETTIQRIVQGVAVDRMRVKVNEDFHQFEFTGPAKDVLDSASFQAGQGGLAAFPAEPATPAFDYSIVPGYVGQVWLGSPAERFYTLTEAELDVRNHIDVRQREFGIEGPVCLAAGQREVRLSFSIYERDNEATKALYQAARSRSPIQAQVQLGSQAGQLFSFYLNAVVLEVPEFDDGSPRVEWKFAPSRAQGSHNDELFIAFG